MCVHTYKYVYVCSIPPPSLSASSVIEFWSYKFQCADVYFRVIESHDPACKTNHISETSSQVIANRKKKKKEKKRERKERKQSLTLETRKPI